VTDFPDWIRQQAGGLRYLGSLAFVVGANGQADLTLAATLLPLERSVVVVIPPNAHVLDGSLTVAVQSHDGAIATGAVNRESLTTSTPLVAYVNGSYSAAWDIRVRFTADASGVTLTAFIFADTDPRLVALANIDTQYPLPISLGTGGTVGTRAKALSLSVVPASEFQGQSPMAGSMAVAIASDQSPVPTQPYNLTAPANIQTGAQLVATSLGSVVVLAAPGVGHHYRVMGATVSFMATGAGGAVDARIADGAGTTLAIAYGLTPATPRALLIPAPGVDAGDNQAVRLTIDLVAAGAGTIRVDLYYRLV
jgi:hypothetical protein